MAERRSTHWRPSSRGCAETGFTLVELLVALMVGTLLMGVALTITLSTRRGYAADQGRVRVNQQLRSSLDLVGVQIRQAGERLPFDFPALEVHDGADGAPDELILWRNLLDDVLPLCATLPNGGTGTDVRAAEGAGPPQGCNALPDDDGDGFPDNIGRWRAFRDSRGGSVWAYVYNPVDRLGEYFLYDDDGTTSNFLHRGDGGAWAREYDVDQQARIYLLEQRRYGLDGGTLNFELDQGNGDRIHLSSNITDFQVRAVLDDGTILDELNSNDDWTALSAIEITLTADAEVDGRTTTRTVSTRFFPRNVLSN